MQRLLLHLSELPTAVEGEAVPRGSLIKTEVPINGCSPFGYLFTQLTGSAASGAPVRRGKELRRKDGEDEGVALNQPLLPRFEMTRMSNFLWVQGQEVGQASAVLIAGQEDFSLGKWSSQHEASVWLARVRSDRGQTGLGLLHWELHIHLTLGCVPYIRQQGMVRVPTEAATASQ